MNTPKLDAESTELDDKLRKLDGEINMYYKKLKNTKLNSEKAFLKGHLIQLLANRKMMEQKLNRNVSQQIMVENIQFGNEKLQDSLNMANDVNQTNNINKQQMKRFGMDKLEDAVLDMAERANGNKTVTKEISLNFAEIDETEYDDGMDRLKGMVDVLHLMKQDNTRNQNFRYNPLFDFNSH